MVFGRHVLMDPPPYFYVDFQMQFTADHVVKSGRVSFDDIRVNKDKKLSYR